MLNIAKLNIAIPTAAQKGFTFNYLKTQCEDQMILLLRQSDLPPKVSYLHYSKLIIIVGYTGSL